VGLHPANKGQKGTTNSVQTHPLGRARNMHRDHPIAPEVERTMIECQVRFVVCAAGVLVIAVRTDRHNRAPSFCFSADDEKMIFRVAPQAASAAEHQERFVRCMTDAIISDKDWPELAGDMETPETMLMNHSNSQLMQRAIEDLRCITARAAFFVKWSKCRIRRLREYCRSRQKPLCRAWPERGSQFASHCLALSRLCGLDSRQ
jgi:hypothetical protein